MLLNIVAFRMCIVCVCICMYVRTILEQQKSHSLLQNAEQTARQNENLKRTNDKLSEQTKWITQEKVEIENKHATDITKFNQRISYLENENQALIGQLNEQQNCLDSAQDEIDQLRKTSAISSHRNYSFDITNNKIARQSSISTDESNLMEMHNDDGNVQFFALDETDAVEQTLDRENDTNYKNLFAAHGTHNSNTTVKKNEQQDVTPAKQSSALDESSGKNTPIMNITTDAMQEYIILSITAAKMKYSDVSISSRKIIQRIEQEKIGMYLKVNIFFV